LTLYLDTSLLVAALSIKLRARPIEAAYRAADALHLAICADHGATLCTLDRRLGEAGPALGVKTMAL